MFKKISLRNWRQFEDVNIDFDQRLTILTGANGAGKTTILNALGKHFGWSPNLVSTPGHKDNGERVYSTDCFSENNNFCIGDIEYFDADNKCLIMVPQVAGTTYPLMFNNQCQQKGLMISSHRNTFHYQYVKSIPTVPDGKESVYSQYSEYQRKKYYEEYLGENEGATHQIKKTLISWAIYGYGNRAVKPNKKAQEMFEGFQNVLSYVLPPNLNYQRIEIEHPEVVLVTKTGNFALDGVSGGIASLIEICWQIYTYSIPNESYVVIIDEPENHLHPELQRSIMPSLLKAFPNVQFIVATHNPFVIGSSEQSKVYVLTYNENNKVVSNRLDNFNKAGTANEILRDVLGIPVTMASWVEDRLNFIVRKYANKDISQENFDLMKNELKEIGLSSLIPESMAQVMVRKND